MVLHAFAENLSLSTKLYQSRVYIIPVPYWEQAWCKWPNANYDSTHSHYESSMQV